MKAKFAKGFTLIEIMVVIVIMGVLAAVAVPKLFGSVAKAKSTEIPLAASSYMKIQDVAVMEHGNVGNWKTIGYIAPGNGSTSFFKYNQGNLTEERVKIDDLGEGLVGWEASNTASLNDCKAGNLWQITITAGESGHVAYNAQVSSDACVAIASAFSQGSIASVGNTAADGSSSSYVPPNGKTQVIGQDLFKDVSMSRVNGRWHEQNGYQEVSENKYSAWKIINNEDNTDGIWKGTYELEPNTTYELTISVPENVWLADQGEYLQTEIRVFTEEPNSKLPAIMLGSRPEDQKPAEDPKFTGWVTEKDADGNIKYPNGNGYNNGTGRNNGYNAEATMKTENGMVTTTIKITTGADGGHLAANLCDHSTGGRGWGNEKYAAADNAIQNATLIKTGDTDKEESSSK